jgi:hypothetical protein
MATGIQKPGPGEDPSMLARLWGPILGMRPTSKSMSESDTLEKKEKSLEIKGSVLALFMLRCARDGHAGPVSVSRIMTTEPGLHVHVGQHFFHSTRPLQISGNARPIKV